MFICYPNPAEHASDSNIPDFFHLSAQVNAPEGQVIREYTVLIDNRAVYQSRLAAPLKRLSIETNLKSPFDTGSHTLRLSVSGVGATDVSGVQIRRSSEVVLCDPFSRSNARICDMSKSTGSLRWSADALEVPQRVESLIDPDHRFPGYLANLEVYSRNLKRLEADVSDAIAVDAHGNLYTASHVMADVELRKYSPDGGILYDALIRSCGDGFSELTAMVANDSGLVWIVGNTTACFQSTRTAYRALDAQWRGMRGMVILVDTGKSSALAPTYLTYLSNREYRLTAVRADASGNAYVAGWTSSADFPHNSLLNTTHEDTSSEKTGFAFIAVLNPSGSALHWSTLLRSIRLASISLDRTGNVYMTGQATSDVTSRKGGNLAQPGRRPARRSGENPRHSVIARLSDRGHRLSYLARFRGSANDEGKAIATDGSGEWVFLAGATNSPEFPTPESGRRLTPAEEKTFVAVLQPCDAGAFYSQVIPKAIESDAPAIALSPALDVFAATSAPRLPSMQEAMGDKPPLSIQVAAACHPSAMH